MPTTPDDQHDSGAQGREPSTTPTTTAATTRARTSEARYRTRRRIGMAVVTTIVIALVWTLSGSGQTTADTDVADAATTVDFSATGSDPLEQVVLDELDAAAQHHAVHGTYRGYVGVQPTVTGDDTVVAFATIVDGRTGSACVLAVRRNGQTAEVRHDPTMVGCSQQSRAALQARVDDLDAATATGAPTPTSAAPQLLQRGAAMIARAAQRNYVDGRPSLLGVGDIPLDGVVVIGTGRDDLVVLRTTTGPCAEAPVTVDGDLGQHTDC